MQEFSALFYFLFLYFGFAVDCVYVIDCFVRTKLLQRRPRLHLPFNAVVTTLSFAFALPVAIALFPQTSSVSSTVVNRTENRCYMRWHITQFPLVLL